MKINHLKFAALAMAGTLFMSSCVGSFGLFNKLASWNKDQLQTASSLTRLSFFLFRRLTLSAE
jgi:hypothetical protein